MFSLSRWWRDRVLARERQRFSARDLDAAWVSLPMLDGMDEAAARRLADLALLFLRAKCLEPVQGVRLDDRMRLLVALQASLPVLELGLDWYSGWYAVILYPDEVVSRHEYVDEAGVVWTESEVRSGESWERGPVILSWADVEAGLDRDGYNVVLHEMAHKLDMRDGTANGCPPLHRGIAARGWVEAMSGAYDDLARRADAGEDTPIDPYGAESPAELFAVCTEVFFELPAVLAAEYPAVYAQLRAFYRQDPLARLAPSGGAGGARYSQPPR